MQTSHSNALNWLNLKQGITGPILNPAAHWSFLLTLYPPSQLSEFLSTKAARDLPRQGAVLQPAEPTTAQVFCCVKSLAALQLHIFLMVISSPRGALWVQHRGNMFHQVSTNLRQLTLLYSSNKVSASLPALLPVTSPRYDPELNGDTIHPLPLSGMRQCVFPLPSSCLVFPLSAGLQRNNPRLVPAQ